MNDEASELAGRAAKQGRAAAKNSGRAVEAVAGEVMDAAKEPALHIELQLSRRMIFGLATALGVITGALVAPKMFRKLDQPEPPA